MGHVKLKSVLEYMMPNQVKMPLCYMWKAKVQMDVHIRAFWSGRSLVLNIY